MKKTPKITKTTVEKTLALGKLIFAFGRIQRAATHEDGVRHETDTDHTVMLGIVACAFADVFEPHLDRGKIAQFALIHDLVEVYCGDTKTIVINHEELSKKAEREHQAHERIKKEFGAVYPWIHQTIEEYESLATPEARFVKTLDKAMPAISYALTNGAGLRKLGITRKQLLKSDSDQEKRLRGTYAHDQKNALALRRLLIGIYSKKYAH
ncbi:MAG: HD domain-containing protein [Patescibacteria group bacterium]